MWAKENKMKIHPAKTKIANSAKQYLDLSVDGMQLTEVESGRVLGVYVDSHPTWNEQTDPLHRKLLQRIAILAIARIYTDQILIASLQCKYQTALYLLLYCFLLKFAPATMVSCDASVQLLFSGDSTSLRAQTVETRSVYCLQPMSVGKMNADYFKSLNYEVQKYEFLTTSIVSGQPTKHKNPSYLARRPLGLMGMSVVGGQMNNIHW